MFPSLTDKQQSTKCNPQNEAQRYAVQCGSKTCGEAIPLLLQAKTDKCNFFCPKCGQDNQKRMQEARALTVKLVNMQVKKADNQENRVETLVLEKLALEARGLLHPTNFLYGLLLRDLHAALSAEGKKDRAFAYLQMALLPISVHVHPFESASTEALSEIIHYHMEKGQVNEASEALTKLVRRLKIVPGEDSEVFEEYHGLLMDCRKSIKNI
ncbi:hypothetical protein RvY_18369-4 [Ramazzottius varieornatus]|uniref:Uncharacterized protein n=1 Tax=Ramazzottius varieornatus TaxID=947166 RepID=A0A1D1WAC6_RAMVA|nr:hypothetical protein RvY_18369-4 [Ramazzottius varieornatus]